MPQVTTPGLRLANDSLQNTHGNDATAYRVILGNSFSIGVFIYHSPTVMPLYEVLRNELLISVSLEDNFTRKWVHVLLGNGRKLGCRDVKALVQDISCD